MPYLPLQVSIETKKRTRVRIRHQCQKQPALKQRQGRLLKETQDTPSFFTAPPHVSMVPLTHSGVKH